MEAIILAAGYGNRLRSYFNKPKYFIDVNGYPLLYYPYYSLYKAGASKIYIVLNNETYNEYREVERFFRLVDTEVIINPYPEYENGYTLVYGLTEVDKYPIIVSVSDHIYPYTVASKLYSSRDDYEDVEFVVAGDPSPAYVDVDEATKIRTVDGLICSIGKSLKNYDYIDMGLFLFNLGFRRFLDRERKYPFSINDLLNRIIGLGGKGRVFVVEDIPWKDVDTIEDYRLILDIIARDAIPGLPSGKV